MEEIWKDIKGFEGKYQVSNLGNVRSLNYGNTGKQRILKTIKDRNGYLKVNLYSDKAYTYRVHQLVAEQFLEKPKLEVNHLSGNKSDNNIDNLEWCTHAENERYSWKTLGKKGKLKKKEKTNIRKTRNEKAIIQYDLNDNYIKRWKSASEAGRMLGIRGNHISACCRGKRNKTGGYKWRFAN